MRGTLFWSRALRWGGSGGERHNTIITHISRLCEQKALIPNIDACNRDSDTGNCSPNFLHYLGFHHAEGRFHLLLSDQVVPFCHYGGGGSGGNREGGQSVRGTLFWNRALGWGGSGGERHRGTLLGTWRPLGSGWCGRLGWTLIW